MILGGLRHADPSLSELSVSTFGLQRRRHVGGGVISFGVGIAVASLFNQHNSGWHNWDMRWDDRRQPVVYRDAPYVSHSTTVVNRVTNINQYNNVNTVNRSSTSTVNNYNTAAAPRPASLNRRPSARRNSRTSRLRPTRR